MQLVHAIDPMFHHRRGPRFQVLRFCGDAQVASLQEDPGDLSPWTPLPMSPQILEYLGIIPTKLEDFGQVIG